MDAGLATARLSLDELASQLRTVPQCHALKVKLDKAILTIENIPAYTGLPPNRWLLTQFFEAAYRLGPNQVLGVVLKDDTGKVLASNIV